MTELAEKIERVKELLQTVKHASMATVNLDGSPHNTPFFFLHDNKLGHIYWSSHPDSQHSQNINRTGQLFVVLYEANKGGGLYISAHNGHILNGAERDMALEIHNAFRARDNKVALTHNYYTNTAPQRMWSATPTGFWVNASKRDKKGVILKDVRHHVMPEDLLH